MSNLENIMNALAKRDDWTLRKFFFGKTHTHRVLEACRLDDLRSTTWPWPPTRRQWKPCGGLPPRKPLDDKRICDCRLCPWAERWDVELLGRVVEAGLWGSISWVSFGKLWVDPDVQKTSKTCWFLYFWFLFATNVHWTVHVAEAREETVLLQWFSCMLRLKTQRTSQKYRKHQQLILDGLMQRLEKNKEVSASSGRDHITCEAYPRICVFLRLWRLCWSFNSSMSCKVLRPLNSF